MSATVIYDADCGLCTRVRDICQGLDWFSSMRWLAQQNAEAGTFGIADEELRRSVYLVTPAGRKYHGFDAVKQVLLRLPVAWAVAGAVVAKKPAAVVPIALFFSPLFQHIGDAGYDLVARNRYRFPGSACTHMDAPSAARG
jgi:predicted DCC family thiol-disulfide oxidoreductase YuxK